jgi:hypothetical protein
MSDIVMIGLATLVFGLVFTVATNWIGQRFAKPTLPSADYSMPPQKKRRQLLSIVIPGAKVFGTKPPVSDLFML